MLGMMLNRAGRAIHQLAAAIGAAIIKPFGAGRTIGAFKAANKRAGVFGWQIGAAALAIGAHFQAHAAAS